MARATNATILAELERLRAAVGKLTSEVGRIKSRLTVVESSLKSSDRAAVTAPRDPGKRLH